MFTVYVHNQYAKILSKMEGIPFMEQQQKSLILVPIF